MAETSSVMISMDADTVPVKKEIAALEKQVKKLENKKLPIEAQMESFNQKAGNARKQVAELKKELASTPKLTVEQMQESMKSDKYFTMNGENISKEIAKSKKEMQEFSDKADKAGEEVELINSQISILKNQLESLKFTGSPDNSMSEVGVQTKANLEKAAQAAGNMGKEIGKAKSNSDELGKSVGKVDNEAGKAASGIKSRMKSAFKSAESSVGSFGKRISNTFKSAFIFSVLYKGLSELKQRLSAMLSTNQQFTTSLNQVKSNLAVAFQPIYQAAMPAINALMQLLVKATAYIAAFVNALFGKSLNSSISAAREMENSIQAVNSGAKGASAAEKELTAAINEKQKQVKALQKENKQLQREYEQEKKAVEAQTDALEKQIKSLEKEIDAIQKAEDAANKAAAAQREAIQANIKMLQEQQEALQKHNESQQKALDEQVKKLQSQQDSLQNKYNNETKAIDKQIKGLQNEIKTIQKAQKAAEEAKRANEKFTASFDELSTLGSVDEADPYDAEIEKVQEKIEALQEEKEKKAEIYENERDAIQDKIDKLQEEKEVVNEVYDAQNARIQEQIGLLQKSQDAIKDVDYSSSIEGYENSIAAIREQIDALNDSLTENPQIEQNEILIDQLQEEVDLLQEKKDAIEATSDAASNFNSSGITNLADELEEVEEKVENSKLLQWLSDNGDKLLDFIVIIGELATIVGSVYGAFKFFSSFLTIFSSPAGAIALVIVAIAGFIAAFGDTEAAVDSLKRILEGFAEFLLGVFTGDIDLAIEGLKVIFGGLLDFVVVVFDAIENMFIEFLEWIVKLEEEIFGIDLSPDIEDAINKSGGYKAYGSIHERIPAPYPSGTTRQIPGLAYGAVLPPNKPFYAMLGDQKNGTNLEAPASLIEEIMRGVMSEQQYNFNVTANGSLGALIRLLNLQFTRESNRETAF